MIIPAYLRTQADCQILSQCVGSLRETVDQEILIIDDASPLEVDQYYADMQKATENLGYFLKNENSGFSKTINIGLHEAQDKGVDACLINADMFFIEPNWFEKIQATEGDIIGAKLLYSNYLIQHAGVFWCKFLRTFDHRFKGSPPNLPAAQRLIECPVTGALQYIRLNVIEEIGYYDEKFPLGFEDVDYCIRATQAGLKCIYNPEVIAIHHESMFRGNKQGDDDPISKKESDSWIYFLQKYSNTNFSGLIPGEVK